MSGFEAYSAARNRYTKSRWGAAAAEMDRKLWKSYGLCSSDSPLSKLPLYRSGSGNKPAEWSQ